MACQSISDLVVRETGRVLPGEIYRRNFGTSPWMGLTQRGVYPMGLSQTISVVTYERTAPTVAEPTWNPVLTVDGAEGGPACLPPVDTISVASTTRTFQPYQRAIEGPPFCAESFRSVFELQQQLNAISSVLAEYTRIEWEIRDRHEYFRACMHKAVVNACTLIGTTAVDSTGPDNGYPALQATLPISLSQLDDFRLYLLRDGAAGALPVRSGGIPVLTVVCSPEVAGTIIRNNVAERQDLDYAQMGDGDAARLLRAFGSQHSYRGFMFITDLYPRRFTYANGAYTEVAAFDTTAATKGLKAIPRKAYLTAPYEETFIFDPTVWTQLVPAPITNPAPNFRFDPVNYTGEWKVQNILDRICNPDGNILYHRGIFQAARMPVHPERGVAFVHQRCAPQGCVATCGT